MANKTFTNKDRKVIEAFIRANANLSDIEEQRYIPPKMPFLAELTQRQSEIFNDNARFKALLCSRRFGKTHLLAAILIHKMLSQPNSQSLFLAITLKQAKRLIWRVLQSFNKTYSLGLTFNFTEFTVSAPNGAQTRLAGIETQSDCDRYRGDAWHLVVIDEAGAFCGTSDHLGYLLDEVLGPALEDYNGNVVISGTPNALAQGFFFDVTTKPSKYKVFTGTILENERFPRWKNKKDWQERAKKWLEQLKIDEGFTDDDPKFLREWCARWVCDSEVLFFPNMSEERNTYTYLPVHVCHFRYVIGVDLGYVDATSMVTLAYSEEDPFLYICDYFTSTKMLPQEISDKILELDEKYNPDIIVVDPAAGGKAHIEALAQQFNLPIQAANKTDKMTNLELLASDFSNGLIKIQTDLKDLFKELREVKWANKALGKVSTSTPDHAADSLRYAYLETLRDRKPRKVDTRDYNQQLEDDIYNRTMSRMAEKQKELALLIPQIGDY